jgi:hypothetical protein
VGFNIHYMYKIQPNYLETCRSHPTSSKSKCPRSHA